MNERCYAKWLPTEDQIEKIIIPAMQRTAQQYVGYANELKFLLDFIALMLRDIAKTFEENALKVKDSCDCC